jgi:ketosteroid isomerase-like protein
MLFSMTNPPGPGAPEAYAADTTMKPSAAAEHVFRPDQPWWETVFAAIDAGDAAGFVGFLTVDAQFRFGNAPVVVGREAIEAAAAGFFTAIASSRHRLLRTWNGTATTVCEGEVTYTRHNGSTVSVPFANVFELRGDKISAYRIFIDNSSLFRESV